MTPIKKKLQDVLNLSIDASDASQRAPVGTRQIQEDGKEVLLILDSDSEGEDPIALPRDVDEGMSSDTAVGDGGFDSEDDDGPAELNSSDSDIDPCPTTPTSDRCCTSHIRANPI